MSLFRCAGDIIFDNVEPLPGQICNVRLKPYSETCNFLQHQSPLTPQHPYFFAQIRALAPKSRITLGIAGPDIAEDAHPGHWIRSVGYHSNTGQCFTSHRSVANTDGEKFGIGDVFGVLVTYFGESKSTVIFLKNGNPVATRYLFESDHNHFLPTISLEHGPIDLGLMWPEAAMGVPQYSEKNMLHWIKPSTVSYDITHDMFIDNGHETEVIIQSPHPLSTEIRHFEIILRQVSESDAGPAIALATCSPQLPTSSCPLLKDYMRLFPDGQNIKVKLNQRIGWGIHFHKSVRSQPNFDPLAEQLVLVFATLNTKIVHMQVLLQPAGGFFPLVILKDWARRVTVDMETNPQPKGMMSFLDQTFDDIYSKHVSILAEDRLARQFDLNMYRCTESVEVKMLGSFCHIRLPAKVKGIHVLQFMSPLTPSSNYFCCQMCQLHEDSVVSIGVASTDLPLNRQPGKVRPSVGWHSRQAALLCNDRSDGNLAGHRIMKGDLIGVEMEAFATQMSVVLFSGNCRPVGTCFYTQSDHDQFLPTIGLCANGHDIEIDVCWQNMNGGAHNFNVRNLEDWCLPPGAVVDRETDTVTVRDHAGNAAIQAPYSLNKGYNHFELRLVDDFSADQPPPALVLSTATPLEYSLATVSNFKLDYLRFWAINEASQIVQKGDLLGWGVLYVEEGQHHDEEQLVICYLTINRKVASVRVVFQPPGGFYPMVILPQGVNRVQLEFSATIIREHPITQEDVSILLEDANKMIAEETEAIENGIDPHDIQFDNARLFRPLPGAGNQESNVRDERVSQTAKTNKMASEVIDLLHNGKGSKKHANNTFTSTDHSQSKSCLIL